MQDLVHFLKEGALIQLDSERFLAAFGPFKQWKGENEYFYLPDFFLEEKTRLVPSRYEILSREKLLELLETPKQAKNWREPEPEGFASEFQRSQDLFSSKELKKIVPVVFARSDEKFSLQSALYHALLQTHSKVYGFWNSREGVLGATPEILFSRKGSKVQTMALAGTKPIGSDRVSMLEDEKERSEHQIVIEEIVSRLKEFGSVQSGETEVMKLKSLEHLKTEISLSLENEIDDEKLVEALHPTPALGGWPKERSFEELKSFSSAKERKRFGAPFGYFSKEESLCLVAIRNIQWNESECLLGSGCGLVEQSELDREWNELQKKRDSVKELMGWL